MLNNTNISNLILLTDVLILPLMIQFNHNNNKNDFTLTIVLHCFYC